MTAKIMIAVAALLALSSPAAPLDRIRIAVSNPNMPNLTVAVAHKKGFFKDNNLDAEIIRMNPNVAITALSTGDIDYCQLFGAVVGAPSPDCRCASLPVSSTTGR
jgi:ABC-type nitrate/sulfonate/bicarbonate transport system substrate-binding protein